MEKSPPFERRRAFFVTRVLRLFKIVALERSRLPNCMARPWVFYVSLAYASVMI